MKSVVLCEKPSVARDIARNLGAKNNKNGCLEGDKYVVTWALGHLITLQTPDKYKEFNNVNLESLPMIPKFMKTEIIKKTFKQYKVVENALNRKDVKEIIIATDAGREGELVARYIIDKAKCNKNIKRLWISSVTDKAIKDGFKNLKDGKEYQKSAILTSAVKNIEVAVTKILNEIKEGKFSKGEHIFGIKENGVGIPKENPNLSEEAKSKIAKAIEELKSGKVEVVATGDELKAKGAATNINGEL